MQLVFRRERLRRSLWHNFRINATVALEGDEKELLTRYDLYDVVLTEGDVERDLKRTAWIAGPISLILYPVIYYASPLSVAQSLLLAFLCFCILSFFIYHQIREEVRVRDLTSGGRWFKARSFIGLLEKEHAIRRMSVAFANVVNQARTWEKSEIINLEPTPLFTLVEGERAAA